MKKPKKKARLAKRTGKDTISVPAPARKPAPVVRRYCDCGHERDAHSSSKAPHAGCIMCDCRITKEEL